MEKWRWDFVFFISSLIVVTLYYGAKIYIDAYESPLGYQLQLEQDQIHQLQNENIELKDKIYQAESLDTISQKAKDMGFVDGANNIMYITY